MCDTTTSEVVPEVVQKEQYLPPKERILVPQRSVGGGLALKFETDPYNLRLYGLLSAQDYTDAMTSINDKLRPSRAGKIDAVLLATGPLMIPLGVWGIRHSIQVKKRKRLLRDAIQSFNALHPELFMRWNRQPQSYLSIERRLTEIHGVVPPSPMAFGTAVAVEAQEPVSSKALVLYNAEAGGTEDSFV